MRLLPVVLIGLSVMSFGTTASAVSFTLEGEFGHDAMQTNLSAYAEVDAQHRLIVAEWFAFSGSPNSDLLVFDASHAMVGRYGASVLNFGGNLAAAPNGHYYVFEVSTGVREFDASFNSLGTFGSHGFGGGITSDSNSNIYIADGSNNVVSKFSPTGQLLLTINPALPHDFFHPNSLAVAPNGTIIVADSFHNRIETFDAAGNFLAMIDTNVPGIIGGHVRDIALADDGTIFTLQEGSGNPNVVDRGLAAFASNGTFLASYLTPDYAFGAIALDGATLYGVDTSNATIRVFIVPEPASLLLLTPIFFLAGRRGSKLRRYSK